MLRRLPIAFFAILAATVAAFAHWAASVGGQAIIAVPAGFTATMAIGFVAATVLLHASGIAITMGAMHIVQTSGGKRVTRVSGFITALGGLWLAMAGKERAR